MIVVCDRCKERRTEYHPGMLIKWGNIEIKENGSVVERVFLCPICFEEFKAFVKGEETPAEKKAKEVCCINCIHLGIEYGVTWCGKKDVVTGIHNSCDDAERKS